MISETRKRVNRIYDEVSAVDVVYQRYAKVHQIGYLDLLFFYVIRENDELLTQKQICDELEISKTTMNSLVKRWMEKGYVELIASPRNKKEKLLHLTGTGDAYAHELIDPLFALEEKATDQISDEELEEVSRIVRKYMQTLDQF